MTSTTTFNKARGALLGGADAVLRPLVNLFHLVVCIFDLLGILRGLLANLVRLGLNGGGGVANILLGRASSAEQGAEDGNER